MYYELRSSFQKFKKVKLNINILSYYTRFTKYRKALKERNIFEIDRIYFVPQVRKRVYLKKRTKSFLSGNKFLIFFKRVNKAIMGKHKKKTTNINRNLKLSFFNIGQDQMEASELLSQETLLAISTILNLSDDEE